MDSETRGCENCKGQFTIEPDDFTFYEKVKVVPPTFCPKCRLVRRLAWRNDLTFYNRGCDMCGRKIISLYHPEKPLTVYCNKCWWGDGWDPKSYGKDIDFSRPFFEQYRELQDKVPLLALFNDDGVGSVNCEYTQNTTFARNCYMGAMSWKGDYIMYYYHIDGPEARDNVDVLDLFGYTQNIYDSVCLEHCYNCRNCYYSSGLTDCSFCYDCKGLTDCFMCANLRDKKYCILNQQYTKEEYEKMLASYRLDTYNGMERARKEFADFLSRQVRRYAYLKNSVNCTGDVLFNCKNVKDGAWAIGCEDVRYLMRGTSIKDSYDLTPAGETSECYEGLTPDHDFQVHFSIYSLKSKELSYVENCHSSQHLFGCSSIKHGEYCILNKQYTKGEYFTMRDKLIAHMKKTGEYGEFFPAALSHFGYNETMAQEYFPLSKDEAIQQGFKWWDKLQRTEGQETLRPEKIPDSIKDVPDSIVDEILACTKCERNYRIVKDELTFYKKQAIPIPRRCFYCRNTQRFRIERPFDLWHRPCMCEKKKHFHCRDHCSNQFETSYAPDRPEIVYCEPCYQAEFS